MDSVKAIKMIKCFNLLLIFISEVPTGRKLGQECSSMKTSATKHRPDCKVIMIVMAQMGTSLTSYEFCIPLC